MPEHNRASDPLDDSERLTVSEVKALKKVAGYYAAGQIVLAAVVGVGAVAMFIVSFYDKILLMLKH